MLFDFLSKIFGSKNERVIKKLQPVLNQINELETKCKALSDSELSQYTSQFKQEIDNGKSLDLILPEAFAIVREVSTRTLEMRHFDAQIIGGIILHQGKIAEMKTGEGKTLAATLPAYLNALSGKSVHIITVNDYLAERDSKWMSKLFTFLGLSVSTITHGLDDDERGKAYSADIIYGTNNEFGFDYLRDNMKFEKESVVQKKLNFAIVDEVDSILIDEARTPLIISGPAEKSTHLYTMANNIIPKLKKEIDFAIDEKEKSSVLTEKGVSTVENLLKIDNLYDPKQIENLHHINQALKAHSLFKLDVDYIIKDNEVVIVDEFTGRLMPGRRYSDGLHQALEAKECVKIENENQTLATVTFQNYFRMYNKLSGMTGTADTEAVEFKKIYDLDVVVIPTNKPMIRKDYPDAIYKTVKEKYSAAIDEIYKLNKKQQPVLVGTISIDVSEDLSNKLKKRGIKHSVLNAKKHKEEAQIIASAGQPGAVTISTNMAGRGTDIVLGEGVKENGGLHILGTSRHESRRIDNQLRGRSGRQGDPGSSCFYMSLEDDLLRIFGGERITKIMDKLGMEEGEPIEHNLISRAIEGAQKKVEGHNFDIRKHLIEYDDVMNQQREIIYRQRREALNGENLDIAIFDMIHEKLFDIIKNSINHRTDESCYNLNKLNENIFNQFNVYIDDIDKNTINNSSEQELEKLFFDLVMSKYQENESLVGKTDMNNIISFLMLQKVDNLWKEHLFAMDHLKEGIGLRGYAQQNPLMIYKKEGFEMFQNLIDKIKEETLYFLFRINIVKSEDLERKEQEKNNQLVFSHGNESDQKKKPVKREGDKIGRNTPCPCGSGMKFKKCCGK